MSLALSSQGVADYLALDVTDKPELLSKTVVVKLNGGLGTGMGLEKAKSLLKVKGDDTFLDFIAQQASVRAAATLEGVTPRRGLHLEGGCTQKGATAGADCVTGEGK